MTTAQIAGLLASTVLPLLVGYLTKSSTSPTVKALLLLLLSAATTAATSVASGANINASITTGLLAYATAVAAHYGLLKPSGAAEAAANAGNKDVTHDLGEDFDPLFPDGVGEDEAIEDVEEDYVGPAETEDALEDDSTPES